MKLPLDPADARFPGPRRYPVAWALGALFWTAYAAAVAAANYVGNAPGTVTWGGMAVAGAVDAATWALMSVGALVLAVRLPLDRARNRVALAAGAVLLTCLRLAAIGLWTQLVTDDAPPLPAMILFLPSNLFITLGLFTMGHAVRGYHSRHQGEQLARTLDAQYMEAELRALQMQLQPHFLFNALNSVSSLMRRDVAAADSMLAELGGLLRTSLRRSARRTVTLREEFDFVRRYLGIEQIRYQDRLRVRYAVDDAARELPVPHLILQPLVENAIKHGIAPHGEPAELLVAARVAEDGGLELEVRDWGAGLAGKSAESRSGGLGLSATRARLEQLYGAAATLELASPAGGGTRARVRLPGRTALPRVPPPRARDPGPEARRGSGVPAEPVLERVLGGLREVGLPYVAVWALMVAAGLLTIGVTNALDLTKYSLRDALEGTAHLFWLWMAVTFPCLVLSLAFPIRRTRIVATVGASVLAGAASILAYMTVERATGRLPQDLPRALAYTLPGGLIVVAAVQGFGHLVAYSREYRRVERHTAELRRQLAQAELRALQMQLQPHFLFNALNSVSSLMRRDVAAADGMLAELGSLLRTSLQRSARQMVALREELEFVRRYLGIEQIRYQDRLRVRYEVDEAAGELPVPHLILQPLVENAIKHGIAPHGEPAELLVAARVREGGGLELEVRDWGAGLPETRGEPRPAGVGLSATRARLEQLYGDAAALELSSPPGGGTRARLSIPPLASPALVG